MENNNILNDVGADDDEDSVPDDDIDEEEDMEDEDEEESEGDDDDDDRVARRHDGVLEGNVAEPLEPGKARRLATDADIVRSIENIGCGVSRVVYIVRCSSTKHFYIFGSLTCLLLRALTQCHFLFL